jgi:hypothetical protein
MNSYSYGLAIHLFGCILFKGIAIPLRRKIGIPLKKERNTYSFHAGINKIRLLPKSPNPLNTQVSYPSFSLFLNPVSLFISAIIFSSLFVPQPSLICCGSHFGLCFFFFFFFFFFFL